MTPEECKRKWELPADHPESWVQENATYRKIRNEALEEAARVAEKVTGPGLTEYGKGHNSAIVAIAADIRALKND